MKRFTLFAFVLTTALLPSAATAQFTPGAAFDTGGNTFDVAVADFDNDGHLDIFSANRYQGGAGQGVNTLFLGDGNGGLTQVAQPNFTTEYGSVGVVALHANNDAFLDVFVTNGAESCDLGCAENQLWLNDGSGEFALATLPGNQVGWDVDSGDFDGNGLMDVAVTGEAVIDIYMQRSGGSFDLYTITYSAFTSWGGKLQIADFTGDDLPDIAVVKGDNGWTARVYPNTTVQDPGNVNNNSVFTHGAPMAWSGFVGNLSSFTAGDFNNDGRIDVAIGATSPASNPGIELPIQIWLNPETNIANGTVEGQFGNAPDYTVGSDNSVRFQLNTADVNADGDLDLLVAGYVWGYSTADFSSVILGNGDGSFTVDENTQYGDRVVVAADMNEDGYADLVGGFASSTANRIYTGTNPFAVTNTSDSGPGSLRDAIAFANTTPNGASPDEILFAIPGAGPHTIALLNELNVTDPVVINGISQPSATCGQDPSDRDLRIVLTTQGAAQGTRIIRLMH